jgi:hypothetical protein
MKKLSLIFAVALAGCHISDSSWPELGSITPPSQLVDAFFAQVEIVTAAMSDDDEAGGIDAIVATKPEDSEPIEL